MSKMYPLRMVTLAVWISCCPILSGCLDVVSEHSLLSHRPALPPPNRPTRPALLPFPGRRRNLFLLSGGKGGGGKGGGAGGPVGRREGRPAGWAAEE